MPEFSESDRGPTPTNSGIRELISSSSTGEYKATPEPLPSDIVGSRRKWARFRAQRPSSKDVDRPAPDPNGGTSMPETGSPKAGSKEDDPQSGPDRLINRESGGRDLG